MSARMGVHVSLWLLFAVVVFPAVAEQPFAFDSTPGQLPKTVVPHHYNLRLQPDFEKFTTRGSVVIDIEVRKSVREILLNALEMKITKATLLGQREIALKSKIEPEKQLVQL